jgi:HD-GYP domain-containing protein (c-di-GMP phosphodiesterase class II)
MKEFLVKEVPPNSFFTKTLYLDKGFVITAPEMPFTEDIILALEKWSFKGVLSEGEPRAEYTHTDSASSELSSEPSEEAAVPLSQQSDSDKLEKAEGFYKGFVLFVEDTFVRASVSNELNYNTVMSRIRDMIDYIKENRRFLMRVLKNIEPAPDKNYLATHSVRSTILAIIIGSYLKLPNHRLIELGVASLVHEAGMLKLPSDIYLNQRALNPQEQKAIITHPVLGYSMLKSFDFPLAICLAALEHHERENGSGYPRHLSGEKISLYSKIIAVACSYEALNSKRPYKEAKDGYTGMLELLKNEGKRYDDTIVRALVVSLSIYPIGLYVLLSNGKKGQVVDVNPETPRFPIVQVFGEFTPDGRVKITKTAQDVLTIVRPLSRAEIET